MTYLSVQTVHKPFPAILCLEHAKTKGLLPTDLYTIAPSKFIESAEKITSLAKTVYNESQLLA